MFSSRTYRGNLAFVLTLAIQNSLLSRPAASNQSDAYATPKAKREALSQRACAGFVYQRMWADNFPKELRVFVQTPCAMQ